MTNNHGDRGHAKWSASATARNWVCAGSLALSKHSPPGKESIHAATGTAVHQIAERCLRQDLDASSLLGTVEKTKSREIDITEDEVNSAQMYIDHVRERAVQAVAEGGWAKIEQYFSLDLLEPPFEAGGTADAVIYFAKSRRLEVIDLKNGQGIVDVAENKQLRTYGLGAVLNNPGLDVETIRVTVVQPRAPHRDGQIRSENFSYADLVEWTGELLERMHLSKQAEDELDAAGNNSVLFDEWAKKWLKPGHCFFCPNSGPCPAQRSAVYEKAAIWLDEDEKPHIAESNRPQNMSVEALADALDALPMIEEWIKALRGYAHDRAEQGVKIPRYVLTEKIGNREWAIDDEAKLIADLAKIAGLEPKDVMTEPKVKSVAQIEKMLPKKEHDKISSMWLRPVRGTNLASEAKTTRPPVASKAESFLDPPK